ncbi:MAG: cytochrome c oxidase subunit I [Solirubrobacterales bacterium]
MSPAGSNGALAPPRPEMVSPAVPEPRPRWIELATSGDHKDIGRMLIAGALSFLVVALVELLIMRLQLVVPENDLVSPTLFNRMLTLNGATLVFFFALPLAFGLFTYVVPLQIGARGVAFPRLANFSFWLFAFGGLVLYSTFVFTPPDVGVNPWPPLSDTSFSTNNGADAWILGCGLSLLGMVLLAVNLATTLISLRAPGMAWRRVPAFSWSALVSSWVLIVAGAAMLAAMTMLEIDRHFNGVFFVPGENGAPVYWQHLSWLFFNSAWLLMILPAIGAISEILPALSGKPPFGRRTIAASMAAIGALGLLAWMQNMFTAGIPDGFLYFAQAAALLLVVPFGVVLFNWIATLAGGAIRMKAPLLFAAAAISTLSIGLGMELMQAVIPVNWQLSSTATATAATGYVLVGGGVLGGLAALHYWYPKMTGRMIGESLARFSLLTILIGAHATLLPLFIAGLDGQPVDIYEYYEGQGLDTLNLISTIGFFVLATGILASVLNALWSRNSGTPAGHDPWFGASLEWFALSPPPLHNFDVIPDVRSAEPLRDIRDAIERRGRSGAAKAAAGEPVA